MLGSTVSGSIRLQMGTIATVALGVALSVARDHGRWDGSAVAVMAYGFVAAFVVWILACATARGSARTHVGLTAAVFALGLALPSLLDPRNYLLGVDRYFGGIENWLLRNQPYFVDWFNGLLMEIPNTFWELVNGAFLILCALSALAVGRLGRRVRDIGPGDKDVGAYFWPTLHTAVAATTLRWSAFLLTATLLLWAWLNARLPDDTAWASQARGFLWFPAVAVILHLAALAQRRVPESAKAAKPGLQQPTAESKSVRPVYERLVRDFGEEPALAHHTDSMPRGTVLAARRPAREGGGRVFGSTEDIPGLLRDLADGGKLLRFGVADRDFYRLFSEAVQHAQDDGQTTLVICPDGAGEEAGRALASITRFFSPEITQRWLRLTRLTQVFTGRVPYDVILVEEHQFHEVLVANGEDFALSLQRTRLVVLIDFHALDACRLNLGLARLQRHLDLQGVAVLCVARRRVGLEEQIKLLFPGRAGKSADVQEFTTRPSQAQRFQICWKEGPDFRAKLRSLGEFTDGPKLDSSVYLSVVGADDGFPVALLADHAATTLGDFENLGDLLESGGQSDLADRVAGTLRLTHYAPPRPVRISIVQDTGNLADAVVGRYDFFRAGDDTLVHVVSWPYPARDFAFDWLSWRPETFASDAIPFAQKPDIGLTELAIRIENALREADGLDEPELVSLLSRASGDLPKDLGLTATRRGLIGLFKSIDPDFRETAIRHETAADQTQRFHLDPAYRVSGITHMAEVVEGGARIGELSPRDEGLTYARDAQIYLNGSFHRVERVEQDDRRVVVTPVSRTAVEHGRRSRNLFRRAYALDLKRFAREQEKGEHLGRSSRLYRMHVHATITRTSDLHLVWPLDEPLPSAATRANPSAVGIEQVRPYRGIYLIAMRSVAAPDAAAFSPMVRRTLSASLQDVLGFLFPVLMERIAVVEIGGEPAFDAAPNYARLAFRYPSGDAGGDRVDDVVRTVFRRARITEPAELGEGWAGVDLAVVEDADGDLGVVRRLHDNWSDMVRIWRRYLDWGAEQPLWQSEEGLFDAASTLKLPIFGGEP